MCRISLEYGLVVPKWSGTAGRVSMVGHSGCPWRAHLTFIEITKPGSQPKPRSKRWLWSPQLALNYDVTTERTHRRNTPSARVPLLTAPSAGSIYLFAQFPTPARVLLSRGLSGGSSKPPTHCSRQAFEATFDKLQLIRTTLISKMIKTL